MRRGFTPRPPPDGLLRQKQVFLPFRNLGTRGRLDVGAVRVDGRDLPRVPGGTEVLDLSASGRPTVIELDLALDLPVELREVLAHGERVPRDVRVVAIADDPDTWYRAAVRLEPGAPPSLAGTLRIEGRAVGRTVTVRAVVCRATAAADPQPGLPAERGARLMETPPVVLRIREAPARVASFLAVRWRGFAGEPALAAWAGQPWALQLAEPPVLWLNQDLPDLVRVLQARGTTGRRARLRDLLFRTIAAGCWPTLFHAAAAGVRSDEGGAPTFAEAWHRDVLAVAADWSYPEIPPVQRLGHLLALLADARREPAHLAPLLEEITRGAQIGLDLAPAVARAASEIGE